MFMLHIDLLYMMQKSALKLTTWKWSVLELEYSSYSKSYLAFLGLDVWNSMAKIAFILRYPFWLYIWKADVANHQSQWSSEIYD